jgi:hypothetical protein
MLFLKRPVFNDYVVLPQANERKTVLYLSFEVFFRTHDEMCSISKRQAVVTIHDT